MDNNFVNIDDLVRQRLGGGEEQERSGAWLRMQELLEKENRRKPMGMLYWKRAMSYVGVVLLLAAVSVGGYEVSSSFRNPAEAGNATNPVASTTGSDNITNPSVTRKGSTVSATEQKHSKNVLAKNTITKNTEPKSIVDPKTNDQSNNNTSVTNSTNNTTTNNTAENTNSVAVNKTVNTSVNNNSTAGAAHVVAPAATNVAANVTSKTLVNNTPVTGTVAAKNAANHDDAKQAQPVATATNTNVAVPADGKKADVVAMNNIAAKDVKKTTNGTQTKKGTLTTVAQLPLSAAVTTPKIAATKANVAGTIAAIKNKNSNVAKPQLVKPTASVKSSALPLSNKPVVKANTDKLMDNTLPKTKQVIAQIKAPRKNVRKTANSKLLASAAHKKSVIAKGNALPASTAPHVDVAANVKPITGKKVMQKILVHQVTTGSYPNRVLTRLDTISIDRTTLYSRKSDAELAAENEVAASEKESADNTAPKSLAKTNNYAATKTAGKKTGSKPTGNRVAANNTKGGVSKPTLSAAPDGFTVDPSVTAGMVASADPVAGATSSDVVPQASVEATPIPAAASSAAGSETKINTYKKKRGTHMLENLSAMFNDVKYKISGVQFAPGLTAGINGTFFGPNSFEGFQFGFTGAFEMDEKWSLLTELKYYHRMNNNYSMSDTYFDLATKDSIISSFSFSTLHSFELPASIKYTAGHMSFFAGANFVYTLAVNTGPDPVPYQVTTIAPNAKTAPSLSQNDFASRFGIGYLFGMSYNVSPNVTLDFRSTQSVWDNAKSTGAKSVSEQLYKSPSLQFSIGYRLGGNKDKD